MIKKKLFASLIALSLSSSPFIANATRDPQANSYPKISKAIIGGQPAKHAPLWMALILTLPPYEDPDDESDDESDEIYKSTCTAEFISKRYVLTAYHCVEDLPNNWIKISYWNGGSEDESIRNTEWIEAKNYWQYSYTDIALVELEKDYPDPDFELHGIEPIQAVPLYHGYNPKLFYDHDGVKGVIQGYGSFSRDDKDNNDHDLYEAAVTVTYPFLSFDNSKGPVFFITPNENEDIASGALANGDSGGPLYIPLPQFQKKEKILDHPHIKIAGINSASSKNFGLASDLNQRYKNNPNNLLAWAAKQSGIAIFKTPVDGQLFTQASPAIDFSGWGHQPGHVKVYQVKDNNIGQLIKDIPCTPAVGDSNWSCLFDLRDATGKFLLPTEGYYKAVAKRPDNTEDTVYFYYKKDGVDLRITYPDKSPRHTYWVAPGNFYTIQGTGTSGDALSFLLEDSTQGSSNTSPCTNALPNNQYPDQYTVKIAPNGIWECHIKTEGNIGDEGTYKFVVNDLTGQARAYKEPSSSGAHSSSGQPPASNAPSSIDEVTYKVRLDKDAQIRIISPKEGDQEISRALKLKGLNDRDVMISGFGINTRHIHLDEQGEYNGYFILNKPKIVRDYTIFASMYKDADKDFYPISSASVSFTAGGPKKVIIYELDDINDTYSYPDGISVPGILITVSIKPENAPDNAYQPLCQTVVDTEGDWECNRKPDPGAIISTQYKGPRDATYHPYPPGNYIVRAAIKASGPMDENDFDTTPLVIKGAADATITEPSPGPAEYQVVAAEHGVSGTGDPAAKIRATEHPAGSSPKALSTTTPLCTAIVNSDHYWSCGLVPTPSVDGRYEISATETLQGKTINTAVVDYRVKRNNQDDDDGDINHGGDGGSGHGGGDGGGTGSGGGTGGGGGTASGAYPPYLISPINNDAFNGLIDAIIGQALSGDTITASLFSTISGALVDTIPGLMSSDGLWQAGPFPHFIPGKPYRIRVTRTHQGVKSSKIINVNTLSVTSPQAGQIIPYGMPYPISGYGMPLAKIYLHSQQALACTTIVHTQGAWACTPSTAFTASAMGPITLVAEDPGHGATVLRHYTVSVAKPAITYPAAGQILTNTSYLVTGSGQAGATLMVTGTGVDGSCQASVNAHGQWSCGPYTRQRGDYTLAAVTALNHQTLADRIQSHFSIAPPIPFAITAPAEQAIVSNDPYFISGTGSPGATVTLTGLSTSCQRRVSNEGGWSCGPYPLAAQSYTVTATQTLKDQPQAQLVRHYQGQPLLTVDKPREAQILPADQSFYTFQGHAHAAYVKVQGLAYAPDCQTNVAADSSWSCSVSSTDPTHPLPIGHYTARVSAYQANGTPLGRPLLRSFSIQPSVTITTPANHSVYNVRQHTIPVSGSGTPGDTLTLTNTNMASKKIVFNTSLTVAADGTWHSRLSIPDGQAVMGTNQNQLTITRDKNNNDSVSVIFSIVHFTH